MPNMGQNIAVSFLNKLSLENSWLEFTQTWEPQRLVAGVDEVGRGALFGPVVAAAVILPPDALPDLADAGIKDSKKLSVSKRNYLGEKIRKVAIDCQIGFASSKEIDRLNILQASLVAMKRAVLKLKPQPELCLVDGNQSIKDFDLPQQTLVKGDSLSLTIAAASIVAKVWRDDLVVRLSSKYHMYHLETNKGYGSKKHLAALKEYGPTPLHRKSFSPCQI